MPNTGRSFVTKMYKHIIHYCVKKISLNAARNACGA